MRVAYLAAVTTAACLGACLVDLDHQVSCGDGYVDTLAGEECDPGDLLSYIHACNRPGSKADCNPVTCELIVGPVQCAVCGDDIIDQAAGEECDGKSLLRGCPSGSLLPTCTSSCTLDMSTCDPCSQGPDAEGCNPCGNGVVDDDEECDPSKGPNQIGIQRACAGSAIGTPEQIGPLPGPWDDVGLPYASGYAKNCNPDTCRYDRTGCGYCGNDRREDAVQVSLSAPAIFSLPEVCDGNDFDEVKLAQQFPQCGESLRPNVECQHDCQGVEVRDPAHPCCIKTGEACPSDDSPLRCCYEYVEPSATTYCTEVIVPVGGSAPDGPLRKCL